MDFEKFCLDVLHVIYVKLFHSEANKDECHALKGLIQSDKHVDDQNDHDEAHIVSAPLDKGAQIKAPSLPENRPFDAHGECEILIQIDDPVDNQNDARIVSAQHDQIAPISAPSPPGNRPFGIIRQRHCCIGIPKPPYPDLLLLSLVSKGTDINAQNPRELTETSTECNKWAMAEFLITNGAVFKPDLRKSHTLFYKRDIPIRRWSNLTSNNELMSVVKLFLLHDVDINSRNDEGDTALHVFLRSVREPLKILTQHDADIWLSDKQGTSVFHKIYAKQVVSPWYANTPLILEVLAFLVSKGLNINLPGKDGDSCLSIAVESANWTLVEHLVALGAHCTRTMEEIYTILEHLRFYSGREHLFITHVLSPMPEERNDNTLSKIPEKTNLRQYQRLLQSSISDALPKYISEENFFVAEALIRRGTDLRCIFADNTLLSVVEHYTYKSHDKWIRCLDALLSRGDIDINCRYRGSSALAKAVKLLDRYITNSPKDPLIQALLERGADPLFTDENGHTLLSLIVRRCLDVYQDSTLNVFKCLVQLGVTTEQPRSTTAICTYIFGTVHRTNMIWNRSIAVLEILIESGTISNHELWYLHKSFEMSLSLEAEKDAKAKNIVRIVKHAACHPRSLRSLCRLVISHAIGVGLERTKRVTSLPLPLSLQKYILFEDILSLNTKQHTHPIS